MTRKESSEEQPLHTIFAGLHLDANMETPPAHPTQDTPANTSTANTSTANANTPENTSWLPVIVPFTGPLPIIGFAQPEDVPTALVTQLDLLPMEPSRPVWCLYCDSRHEHCSCRQGHDSDHQSSLRVAQSDQGSPVLGDVSRETVSSRDPTPVLTPDDPVPYCPPIEQVQLAYQWQQDFKDWTNCLGVYSQNRPAVPPKTPAMMKYADDIIRSHLQYEDWMERHIRFSGTVKFRRLPCYRPSS